MAFGFLCQIKSLQNPNVLGRNKLVKPKQVTKMSGFLFFGWLVFWVCFFFSPSGGKFFVLWPPHNLEHRSWESLFDIYLEGKMGVKG